MLYNLLHLPNLVCCHDSSSTSGLFSSWIVFEGTWVPGFQNSVARSVGNTVWMENLFVEALGPFFFLRKSIAPWTRALICVTLRSWWMLLAGANLPAWSQCSLQPQLCQIKNVVCRRISCFSDYTFLLREPCKKLQKLCRLRNFGVALRLSLQFIFRSAC